ncbi:phytanoyl-CoA dioxygenase family protein [Prochlorococcus sp. MIT 0604]|uniref:phytanoyl-CoA dioxygenase family protein n=1 Tax=Prochlorococcus sp. MIT 0604 TaxID=1501268 RepID=UPI0004F59078|nr:phytanoyl-CoA dioxygenase family protein [Prochlorococcus sp. MIT 0604]AIQ95527.1 hypothetical protein EW14_1516 [Prochlorococcus sp. MIT 0604]
MNYKIFNADIKNIPCIIENIINDGFAVINNIFTKKLIDLLFQELIKIPVEYSQIDPLTRLPIKTLHHFNMHNFGNHFRDLPINNFIDNINSNLLNDKFYKLPNNIKSNHIIGQYTARSAQEALNIHTDDRNPISNSKEPTWIQWLIPLQETNIKNGCTILKPRTHNITDSKIIENTELLPIELKPGQAVCWDGRLLHGALENQNSSTRWALIMTFTRWYIRQEFNMLASMDEKMIRNLSDREKYLYGATVSERWSPKEGMSAKGDINYANKKISQFLNIKN